MKTRRRYREKNHIDIYDSIFRRQYIFDGNPRTVISRIRDCWGKMDYGTLMGDGSVLWDNWRPATKRQLKKRKIVEFIGIHLPIIKQMMPSVDMFEIMDAQPMFSEYVSRPIIQKYEF